MLETIQSEKPTTSQPVNLNSLTRIESKKELLEKQQKSQHLISEDLIIHENINDSSCTPANISALNQSLSHVKHMAVMETIQHEE